jgi:hypothetical protein
MAFARDHTSVIHACNAVARRREADPEFARLIDRIVHQLTAEPHDSEAARNAAVSVCDRPASLRNEGR